MQIRASMRTFSCEHMHRNDFVTQKVSRHRSFSVWTRAWTRLVVDTLRGNMSVEPKHRKLWDELYTYTSYHEKICMRRRPCKSNSCAEGRFFHSEYTSQSFAWVKPMISDMISYVESCIHTRPPMWKFAHAHDLVSQTICLEGRIITFNKSNRPLHQSNQCTQTWFRMLMVGYWKGFVSKKSRVVVWEFRYIDGKIGGKHSVMLIVTHMHVFVSRKVM